MNEHTLTRITDPSTSFEAATKAALGASKVRPVVLNIVRENGPLTHDELIAQYHRQQILEPDTPGSSESGIRTRLHELVEHGLVIEDTQDGYSLFNNRAKRWVCTEVLDGLISDNEHD